VGTKQDVNPHALEVCEKGVRMSKIKSKESQCRRCGNPLPQRAREHRDPYCSTVCCKAAYHVVDKVPRLSALRGTALLRETRAA
jgi:hypothetical protein